MLTEKQIEVEALLEKQNDIWICKACDKSAVTKQALRNHAETHISGLTYDCDFCGKIFNRKNTLTMHKSNKHRKTGKKTAKTQNTSDNFFNAATDEGVCSITKSHENESIENNLQKTESEVTDPLRDLIPQDINKEIKLKIQELLKRNGPNTWQCTICEKKGKFKISLINHVESHLDYSHPCPQCSLSTSTRKDLKLHYRECHM